MSHFSWQPTTPLSAIIFDCDGTLSTIEGIDELAKNNQVTDIVQRLTQDAMGKTGMNINLYQERLALVKPTQQSVNDLGNQYIAHHVPDVENTILLLHSLKKPIYIVSAGLTPAVVKLAEFLHIPAEHVFAVDIQFDQNGNYLDFDRHSPLVNRNGKRVIVEQLKKRHAEIAFVGDGLNDLEAKDLVTRFIGYGGIFYREYIKVNCDFYITSASMLSLLPLVLTEDESMQLSEEGKKLYQRGVESYL